MIQSQIYNKIIDLYGDGIGKVEYVSHMGNDLTIVNAARVSLGKHKEILDDSDEKLIKYLMKNKHTSTLEHCCVSFRFKVPLFVRSQHHRHRTWAYNEISRRYTDENVEFYQINSFRSQHSSNRQASNLDEINPGMWNNDDVKASDVIKHHHDYCLSLYNELLRTGVCREQARGVLPQNIYTEYYGTVNLNNLIKFIVLRDDPHAQLEIQVVGKACRDIATDLFPIAMKSFNELRSEKTSH